MGIRWYRASRLLLLKDVVRLIARSLLASRDEPEWLPLHVEAELIAPPGEMRCALVKLSQDNSASLVESLPSSEPRYVFLSERGCELRPRCASMIIWRPDSAPVKSKLIYGCLWDTLRRWLRARNVLPDMEFGLSCGDEMGFVEERLALVHVNRIKAPTN